eukprot:TRINITY_DN11131_c0_g2_i2.p1 TRINITY_DN11131_c0_g2~~TRINITY_DN11131_c0_g2_i2.p1  ORF type:complete len:828 (+),score=209.30 TRINITY_DN11131_c0_g2_i2:111-2594(+)
MEEPIVESINTMFDYEQVFTESERLLREKFELPLKRSGIMDEAELTSLFGLHDTMYNQGQENQKKLQAIRSCATDLERLPLIQAFFMGPPSEYMREYVASYIARDRLLAKLSGTNDRFCVFLTLVEKDVRTSLETLIRRPLDHLSFYNDMLHRIKMLYPRRDELDQAWELWDQLNEAKNEIFELREVENRLASIQLSFQSNELQLLSREEEVNKRSRNAMSRRSAATTPLWRIVQSDAVQKKRKEELLVNMSDMDLRPPRHPVHEGPVKSIPKAGEVRPRYLYLLSDMLLVGKPRNNDTYKLKAQLFLADSWINPTPSGSHASDLAFQVGAPNHRRMVFLASNPEEKTVWVKLITAQIAASKSMAAEPQIPIRVLPFLPSVLQENGSEKPPPCETLKVFNHQHAIDVQAEVLERIKLNRSHSTDYILYQRSSSGLTRLQKWECPMAIAKAGQKDGSHDGLCDFVMRHVSSPALSMEMLPVQLRVAPRSISVPRTRRRLGSPMNTPPTSSSPTPAMATSSPRGGKNKRGMNFIKKIIPGKRGSMVPDAPSTTAPNSGQGAFFGQPLDMLCADDKLPEPVEDMLGRLYYHGPEVEGIFRKSANGRLVDNLRKRLDDGSPVDFLEISVLVVGAAFKQFLRQLPNCLISQKLYDELAVTNGIADQQARADRIRELLSTEKKPHQLLLKAVIRTLAQIASAADITCMTSSNLGICVGPSMLWPTRAELVLNNDVPTLVEFMIEHPDLVFDDIGLEFLDGPEAHRRFTQAAESSDDDDNDTEDETLKPAVLRQSSMPAAIVSGDPLPVNTTNQSGLRRASAWPQGHDEQSEEA